MKTDQETPPPMADIDTASDDYATRFAGPSGQWLLDVQAQGTYKLLKQTSNVQTILDVGGGHAQLTELFLKNHRTLTIAGSAPACSLRLQPFIASPRCQYIPANLLQLPFSVQSFDLVASFRLLTHCESWEELVAQCCRVARKYVLVDYPTTQSVNAIAPAFFGAKKKVERNTRYWHSFRHAEIDTAFTRNEFRRVATFKQFFFPMALHRMLRSRMLSRVMEGIARGIGCTRMAGSPVIVLYERKTTTHELCTCPDTANQHILPNTIETTRAKPKGIHE